MRARINVDYNFIWHLLIEGEEVDWAQYNLTVEMLTPSHKKEAIDFTVNGTDLHFSYKPTQVGQYIISAFINRFAEDEHAVDVKIFEGVRWSWNAESDDDELVIETVTFDGNIRESVVDTSKYYTKEEVDEKIDETVAGSIDLSKYYTKSEIDNKGYLTYIPSDYVTESELRSKRYATETWVENKNYLTSIPSNYVTESELTDKNYATKDEVSEMIKDNTTESGDLTGYATESWVEGKGYLTAIPDTYALKTDIPTKTSDLTNDSNYLSVIPDEYVTSTELEQVLTDKGYATTDDLESVKPNLTDYYTKSEVEGLIDKVNAGDIDLTGYYTKGEVDELVDDTKTDLTGYATELWVEGKGYLTAIPDTYALKSDIPTKTSDLTNDNNYLTVIPDEYVTSTELEQVLTDKGYATTDDLGSVKPDLTGYATESWVEGKGYLTTIPDTYALKSDIPTKTSDLTNDNNYLTVIPDEYVTSTELEQVLTDKGYATTDDLESVTPDLTDYYTKSEVEGLIDKVNTGDIDLTGYYTKGEVDEIVNDAKTDLTGYATELWVEGKGYLTAIPDTYALKSDIPTKTSDLTNDNNYLTVIPDEYVTSTELEQVLTDKGYATTDDLRSVKPDLTGYATESWVEGKGYLTAIPDTYALKSDIPTKTSDLTNDNNYLTVIPDEYVTSTELEQVLTDKGYVTTDDLGSVKPDLTGYATESWVEGKGYLTEHQDISGKVDGVGITKIVSITLDEYNSLETIENTTLYILI